MSFEKLKIVNKHKFVSFITHLHWFYKELNIKKIASIFRSVTICIDRENFPNPEEHSWALKLFASSILQGLGMPYWLTGDIFNEDASHGSVKVDIDCDSSKVPGLEVVDVLLQGVCRNLEDFR